MQNCWPPTAVHKCDPIIRLINSPLRMCREIAMYGYRSVTGSDYGIKQYVKIFFYRPAVFLEHTQDLF